MNAGFSNLATLKAHLLAPSLALAAETTYDAVLTTLGLGVAAHFDSVCNRKFTRAAGTTDILPADMCQFLLPRFPVESISAIDLKTTEADGWVAQVINDFVRTIDLAKGIVYLPDGADAGPYYAQLRFTYTGGYFWNILEPADVGYPTALPSGANALPPDLKLAWLLQCEAVWKARDKLGTEIIERDDVKFVNSALSELKLVPQVKAILQQFTRINMV